MKKNQYLIFTESCVWGEWVDWTDCNATCGGGHQNRTRPKTSGGDDCAANSTETQECNTDACTRKRSVGVFEQLAEAFIRKKREVRYKCNLTMTYGVMFYDIRNNDVSSLLIFRIRVILTIRIKDNETGF